MSSLYTLEVKPLSEVVFANSFPYGWYPFHLADVFFSCAEALYFDEVPFVYSFLYVPYSRGYISENIAAWNIFSPYVLL